MGLLSVGNDMHFIAPTAPYKCKVLGARESLLFRPSQVRKIVFYLLLEMPKSALLLLGIYYNARQISEANRKRLLSERVLKPLQMVICLRKCVPLCSIFEI